MGISGRCAPSAAVSFAWVQAGIVICHDHPIFGCKGAGISMKKITLVSPLAAGLALFLASGAIAAVNPTAPNPYPTRDSKLLVDFTNPVTVTSDPLATGGNVASINTDPQFTVSGTKSLKLDFTGLTGAWTDPGFVIQLPAPFDIKGYQVLAMDVFIPDTSIDTTSWYQFIPHPTTTSPTDATMTSDTYYGPGNLHSGWNHMIWTLKNGTDTTITQIPFAVQAGAEYSGPVYVDNIRAYKGSFVGVQPDETLIMGFDKPTDKDLFTTLNDPVTAAINTDPKFISQGAGSLKIDLTGWPSGWTNSVASADDWGTTIDASKATALHLDFYVPSSSHMAGDYHELGFGVHGDGGDVSFTSEYVTDDQWVTLEVPLTPDQAAMLTNVKGLFFITNSGKDWTGPIYVDGLRAVMPATKP
jgi:hypothetical protein